jgi:type IV pilus assembly protein PilY1
MSNILSTNTFRCLISVPLLVAASLANAVLSIPDTPLISTKIAKPLTMIVAARDHKLFYEAYNDVSDVDGDGVIDTRFKPAITYYGLFDSTLCYTHNGKNDNTGLYSPADKAGDSNSCSGKKGPWSGNFLNYLTTSRIDALRKVLYGGYRETDLANQTILRRAYIPQDAHSWGKEYTSEAVDKYKISDYADITQPTAGKRHFFGSVTPTNGVNCAVLSDCSNLAPWLAVVKNSNLRIWEWASTERPVLNGSGGGTRTNYTVRVEVCTTSFAGGCKKYPNGSYKPTGLLHDYGENESMLFGLLTGSYDHNMSGGILRKVVSSFKDEVDQNTGIFTANATIVNTFNAMRIRDFNNSRTDNAYRRGDGGDAWVTTRPMAEGEFKDWGNPLGEMMYEALRYFAGAKEATKEFTFTQAGSTDSHVGLPFATWDDPYSATGAAKAPYCAKPNLLAISDINPSFDSDQLPGSAFNNFKSSSLGALNVKDVADKITAGEPGVTGLHYIGQNCVLTTCADSAPTAKNITSLGTIRGLAPEEPNKQGSYNTAAVAYFGKTTDLRTDLKDTQVTDTYAVALASPLPKFEIPLAAGKITLIPFAKSVSGSGIDYTSNFQPTNQLVDFYVESIANSNGTSGADYDKTINSGRYYAKFRINFEDVEQGADHDMDAISEYEISEQANGTLRITVNPTYQAGGIRQNMGYIISGTTKDGIYLVVQDENVDTPYRLNTPPGRDPGYCNVTTPPNDCKKLPYIGSGLISDRTFTAGGEVAATLLKDPLWYAAKWGGYVENNAKYKNDKPDDQAEWDADKNGTPDTYFLVQNPLKLKESLNKSFDTIVKRSASAGNITSNGQQLVDGSKVFQTKYDATKWEGEVKAWEVTAAGVQDVKWLASTMITAEASAHTRHFISWNTTTKSGVLFTNDINANWSKISAPQQTLLGSTEILSYILGDQSKEMQNGGVYRNRGLLLGDIVHSSPYYVKDSSVPTVYAGANDGMLHAFNGDTGEELFAYIPGMVYSKLSELPSASYSHKFFVDGDLAVSSRSLTPGKNYLIASLGRGFPGVFGLDVTDPSSITAASALWEYSATSNSDADFGYALGRPQLGLLNNGVVAAVIGNGYNSANGSAVLYIINIQTGAIIKKIDTAITGDNGLATPRLWDANNDGKADYVYAGDLKGNVWKFDISDTDPNKWKLDAASPIFVAKDTSSNPQPITAQILVAKDTLKDDPNFGKTFLLFGTGSYYFSNDPVNRDIQSWYGIIDEGKSIPNRSSLTQRTIAMQDTILVNGVSTNVRVFSDSVTSPTNDMDGKKGWYIDLKYSTATGERIVSSTQLISAIEPVALVSSLIPTTSDPCDPQGGGYVNSVNAFTGASLKDVFIDINGDGKFNASDMLNGKYIVGGLDPGVQMPGEGVKVGDQLIVGGSDGEKPKNFKINLGTKTTGRVSWREIRFQ